MVKSTQNESHTFQLSKEDLTSQEQFMDFHEFGWCMKYEEFKPGNPLSQYVQLIWTLESEPGEDT